MSVLSFLSERQDWLRRNGTYRLTATVVLPLVSRLLSNLLSAGSNQLFDMVGAIGFEPTTT